MTRLPIELVALFVGALALGLSLAVAVVLGEHLHEHAEHEAAVSWEEASR